MKPAALRFAARSGGASASRSRNRPWAGSDAITPASAWRWASLGAALGLLVSLVMFAPATWLAAGVESASSGRVQLLNARGSLWTGSALLQLTGGEGSRDSALLPGAVGWKIRPAWLGVNITVNADCCTPTPIKARLSQSWAVTTLELADGSSEWPAALLAGLGTPWNTVQATGVLRLASTGLSAQFFDGRWVLGGQAELRALGISSRLSTLQPMGSYRAVLAGGNSATLEVSTLEGSLQLSGTGQWVGSRLRFNGLASAAPEDEAVLSNLLNIIGRRSGARSTITLG
jgi:general secretion pathway protein N